MGDKVTHSILQSVARSGLGLLVLSALCDGKRWPSDFLSDTRQGAARKRHSEGENGLVASTGVTAPPVVHTVPLAEATFISSSIKGISTSDRSDSNKGNQTKQWPESKGPAGSCINGN